MTPPPLTLHPLHHRTSQSSLISSTTYHSLEPSPLPSTFPPNDISTVTDMSSSKQPTAVSMARTDSGYSDSTTPSSSSVTKKKHPRPTISTTDSSSPSRSTSSRSTRTARNTTSQAPISPTTSTRSRPLHQRTNTASSTTKRLSRPTSTRRFPTSSAVNPRDTPYSYFQFPELNDTSAVYPSPPASRGASAEPEPDQEPVVVRHVPATVQYWTSAETRRREYEAIDASSRGVRGFCLKMLPECMVPKEYKVLGFSPRDGEEEGIRMGGGERGRGATEGKRSGKRGRGDDGSVRRYRISLDEGERGVEKKKNARRGSWWGFGGRSVS